MLLATALAPLTLAAAEKRDINIVENYAAVAKSTPEDGFVVVTYADGWDKFSKKTVQLFYKNKAMQAALKNSAVIEYGAPNLWVNPD